MAGDPERSDRPLPSLSDEREPDPARVVRWRRRTATFFWGVAAVFSITSSAQVGMQLFSPEEPADHPASCAEGISQLQASLDAGWAAARREDDSPERALDRFRGTVGPSWRHLPWLQRACRADPGPAARLDALERLRYALESRVRVDGGSLAALRRRALGASSHATTGDPTAPADEEGPEPALHQPSDRPAVDPSRKQTR
jgi:hypothetical protein